MAARSPRTTRPPAPIPANPRVCPLCHDALPRLVPGLHWPARQRAQAQLRVHASGACTPGSSQAADLYAMRWELVG